MMKAMKKELRMTNFAVLRSFIQAVKRSTSAEELKFEA
jgi:hypothetical protein